MNDEYNIRLNIQNTLAPLNRNVAPSIFLPFALTVLPCALLAVLTFGVSLIFTGFIWLVLDNYIFRFLESGEKGFKAYFKWDMQVLTYFTTSILRRLILIISYACLIFPGIYLSASLSFLPYIIRKRHDIRNPFVLIKLAFIASNGHRYELFKINIMTFYMILLTILSFGIIAPWSVPYIKSIRVAYFMNTREIPLACELFPIPDGESDQECEIEYDPNSTVI